MFWKALDELNPNMMLLLISGRLVFEILKDKAVNKTFDVKRVVFLKIKFLQLNLSKYRYKQSS